MTSKEPKVFTFAEQLKVGNKGEELFFGNYREPLEKITAHYGDFKVPATGEVLELKTDTYCMDKSPNFFMERFSDVAKESPGGPWQARFKGASRFCYLFLKQGVYFEFLDLDTLVKRLDEMIKGMSYIAIRNRGYTARGYKVPREELEDLWTKYTIKKGE